MRTMIAAAAACLAAGCADAGASARVAASGVTAAEALVPAPPVRGFVTYDTAGPLLRPCGWAFEMTVDDSTGGVLLPLYARLSGGEGPVFMELRGTADPLGDSVGPPVSLTAREVRYAAPVMDARGCDEDLAGVELRAGGADPHWSVSVARGGITVARAGDPARIHLPYRPPEGDGGTVVYKAAGDGHLLELLVAERPCEDAEGAWSALSARAVLDGRVLRGCARHGGHPLRPPE